MTKSMFILSFVFLSINLNTNIKNFETSTSLIAFSQQQNREISYKAYVQINREWKEGYVYLVDGLVTRVQFPSINAGTLKAEMYESKKPTALNPNNPIAIKNNFTHYVDIINYGRAYFIM